MADPKLRAEWESEVAEIRDRIREMRALFVETLKKNGVKQDFSFIARQNGMFSFSGLTKEQFRRCATSTRSISSVRVASTSRA